MKKIYCDTGACTPELRDLQRKGVVELFMFKYENKNRHIKESGQPSAALIMDMKNYTYDDVPGTFADYSESVKYQDLVGLLGLENRRVDILHLDSAYKTRVDAFVSNDKDDVIAYRDQLERMLGFKIFHTSEFDELTKFVQDANK